MKYVFCTENRDYVWEQVICLERGSSARMENTYSVREQIVARNYIFSIIRRCYGPKQDILDY